MGLEQAALGSFSLEEEEDVTQMVHDSKEPTLSTTHIRAAELEDASHHPESTERCAFGSGFVLLCFQTGVCSWTYVSVRCGRRHGQQLPPL